MSEIPDFNDPDSAMKYAAKLEAELAEARGKVERLGAAAEKQLVILAEAGVDKLTELRPDAGWDSGEEVAKVHIREMYRKAALTERGGDDGLS